MSEDAVRCGECGGPGDRLYEGLCDRHFGGEGSWAIAYCKSCDRYGLDPEPSADQIRNSYREYYTHDGAPGGGFEGWLKHAVPGVCLGYRDRVSWFQRVAGGLVAMVGPLRTLGERAVLWLGGAERGRLLDVGCGSGETMLRMRDLGWEVVGVEFDVEAARVAAERAGAPVLATLEEVEAGSFDAVVLDHVVEHLADAPSTLRSCWRALRPGGRLALATPNAGSAARHRFGPNWLHWDPPRHLALRGERGLRDLVCESGFEVDRMFSCGGSAHFVWNASRLIERDGVLPGIRIDGLPLADRMAGLRFWLAEQARVARGEACGEEWVVLARRPEGTSERL